MDADGSFGDSDGVKESGSKKRPRTESCASSSSKAGREKMRMDKLYNMLIELTASGKPPKTEKEAVLVDALRKLTRLQTETQKFKYTSSRLQEKIKKLETENNELLKEKQRLKAVNEMQEQQLKTMTAQPSFVPPAMPAAFSPHGEADEENLRYHKVLILPFPSPASVDISQDYLNFPPIA